MTTEAQELAALDNAARRNLIEFFKDEISWETFRDRSANLRLRFAAFGYPDHRVSLLSQPTTDDYEDE